MKPAIYRAVIVYTGNEDNINKEGTASTQLLELVQIEATAGPGGRG